MNRLKDTIMQSTMMQGTMMQSTMGQDTIIEPFDHNEVLKGIFILGAMFFFLCFLISVIIDTLKKYWKFIIMCVSVPIVCIFIQSFLEPEYKHIVWIALGVIVYFSLPPMPKRPKKPKKREWGSFFSADSSTYRSIRDTYKGNPYLSREYDYYDDLYREALYRERDEENDNSGDIN